MWFFNRVKSGLMFERSRIEKWNGRKTKEKEVMHSKNLSSLCFLLHSDEFIKRAWKRRTTCWVAKKNWVGRRRGLHVHGSPWLLLFAFCRLGLFFLGTHGVRMIWLCLGVIVSIIVIVVTFIILFLFVSLFHLLLFKTLVIFQSLSCKVQYCSWNYSLAEEMTNLKVCG